MCPGTGEEGAANFLLSPEELGLVPGAEESQDSKLLMAESVSCELKENADLHRYCNSRCLRMQDVSWTLTEWPRL